MDRRTRLGLSLSLTAVLAVVPLTACTDDVREGEPGETTEVDIDTPVGDVLVRRNMDTVDTGLRVYPGARPLRDDDEPENADVNVGNASFGVKVVAARFESPEAEDRILDFYREELKMYGAVTECRGNVDFTGRRGSKHPVCKEWVFSRGHTQLVAGIEDRRQIVSVKRRDTGSEFALVYLETRGEK